MSAALVGIAAALSVALMAGAGAPPQVESDPEACLRLAAASEGPADEVRLLLFGIPESEATAYFATHRLAAASAAGLTPAGEGTWLARLGYTSFNAGPDDRPSDVMYPHEATIHGDYLGVVAETIRSGGLLLLLAPDPDAAFAYAWLGCATGGAGGVELDWFADKPHLHFREPEARRP